MWSTPLLVLAVKKNYIMETKSLLADRFTEHHRSITINFHGLPIAAHFNSSEHSIFYVVAGCVNDTYRKIEEERLINKRGTLEPRGMNVRIHYFPVSIVTP